MIDELRKPSLTGWAATKVTFYFADDPHCHAVELEIVHINMMQVRHWRQDGNDGSLVIGLFCSGLERLRRVNGVCKVGTMEGGQPGGGFAGSGGPADGDWLNEGAGLACGLLHVHWLS